MNYGEPWELGEQTCDAPCSNAAIETKDRRLSIHVRGGLLAGVGADRVAEHIIACVNFCRKFPTEWLADKQIEQHIFEVTREEAGKLREIPGFVGCNIITRRIET